MKLTPAFDLVTKIDEIFDKLLTVDIAHSILNKDVNDPRWVSLKKEIEELKLNNQERAI